MNKQNIGDIKANGAMAFMPEVLIYNVIKAWIQLIVEDHNLHRADKDNSWLYLVFGETEFSGFKFYEEAVKLFVTNGNTNQRLNINIGFNPDKVSSAPCVSIIIPDEQMSSQNNGIGFDEDYVDAQQSRLGQRRVVTRAFDARYVLLFTSLSFGSTTLLYNVFKQLIMGYHAQLENEGLMNLSMSGRSYEIQQDLLPPGVSHRSIETSFVYETSAPALFTDMYIFQSKLGNMSV